MEEIVGQGKYRYRVHWDWAQHAPEHVEVRAQTFRSICRTGPTVLTATKTIRSWFSTAITRFVTRSAGLFLFPHAIRLDRRR